jgi:class 3 adenylate cyclase
MEIPSNQTLFDAIRELNRAGTNTSSVENALRERFGDTRAVLVFDACGFSRLTRSHGIVRYLERLIEVRSRVRPILESFGCMSFRTEADNIYAQFPGAEEALDAAIASCEDLGCSPVALDVESPGEQMRIATGIGFGELLCCPVHGAFGDEMNLASKLGEDVAGPGEVLLTRAAWSSLPEERRRCFMKRSVAICGLLIEHFALIPEVR